MKSVLIAVGLFAASLAAWVVMLIIGVIAAGKSHAGAESAVVFVLGGQVLVFIAGCVALVRAMSRAGAPAGARVAAGVTWSALSVATWVMLAFITALAFNR